MKVTMLQKKQVQRDISVGDVIKFKNGEIRYIARVDGKYCSIDLGTGYIGASADSLSTLQNYYVSNEYIVCKISELVLEEI